MMAIMPFLACLGNPDPVDMKVSCPKGKKTFDDETTEEATSGGVWSRKANPVRVTGLAAD